MKNHFKAVGLAKEYLRNEQELLAVLVAMKNANEFGAEGYANLFCYVVGALKLSESQAGYFNRVVGTGIEVPRLPEAVINGELSLSQARRIASVVTAENCDDWIGKANGMKQYDLEKAVTEVNPKAKIREGVKAIAPELSKMVIALSAEAEGLLNEVKELECQRTKSSPSWNDIMIVMAKRYLEKNCPLRKAKRLSSRTAKVTPVLKRGRQLIAASLKHQIHLRDGFQCTAGNPQGSRCEQKRWLEIDHIKPVSAGGVNTLENLRTLCSFHHQLRHSSAETHPSPREGCVKPVSKRNYFALR